MVTNYFRAFYYLYSLLRSAYWDEDRLSKYQNNKIRNIIRYSYDNVPYYHRIMKNNSVHPDDIRSKDDLNKIPIIRKEDIRENYDDMISLEYKDKRLKQISTSGSTGKPLFLNITQAEDEFRKAKLLRAHIVLGQKPRDRWVIITSPHHFGSTTGIQRFVNFFVPRSASVFDDVSTQLSNIRQLRPDVLDGYSSSLYILAKEMEGKTISGIHPKFLIGGAELIDLTSRRFIEDVFKVPFYDQYACIEFERVAWECKHRVGYHMDCDSLVVEFVNNNEIVSIGESGEIICTSLFNYAMPLIRYSIGDIGIQSDEKCTCGRTLPLMKVVEGRTDSLLTLPNGKLVSPRSFTVAMSSFEFYHMVDQFRIVQKKINLFHIYLKIKNESYDMGNISRRLVDYLRNTLLLDVDDIFIEVEFVDDIPLDKSGKLMMVLSEL